ncbi:IS66 family insertion sequence element accessory protein TnpB (plasmid) [Paracoccus methylovorus]|uniref:IS66 family insertion sequence element accessory protein TnpB n=1 Tax=Paracoccus methylovorus TaxID=2812658 RepID=A0ABX7JP50_9RHOB|nr:MULTISPECIES: IS66 family insertion sequence element accessory protein TnpB [Paracoccus]QRZ16052.1 IS66 family insertion sequence element accessory protein TnpB [Paracoccus methylovorus]
MVATKPVDFRKGHDGLAALVPSVLRKDPFTGTVFVFRARRADRLKLLYWDGTGLVMAYKRLEDATFTWPAIKDGVMALNHAQLEALLPGSQGQGSGNPPASGWSRGPSNVRTRRAPAGAA